MINLWSLLGLVLGVLALTVPAWNEWVSRLGLASLYRLGPLRLGLALLSLAVTLGAYALRPSRGALAAMLAAFALAGLAYLLDPKQGFVALDRPPHVGATQAGLGDKAPVLGVEIDGMACAWPLEMIVPHHIVNDRLGATPVLVAYCGACRSGSVYAASVDGQVLTFDARSPWRWNMIMRDRETGSLWQQATGEAVFGPLAGRQLQLLGGEQTTWAGWRDEHPQTELAVEPEKARDLLPRGMLRTLLQMISPRYWTPELTLNDRRLPIREEVAGISIAGESRAYPLSLLRQNQVVNDQLGGIPIAVVYQPGADRVRAFDRRVGDSVLTLEAEDGFLVDAGRTVRWNGRGEPTGGTVMERLQAISVQRIWWRGWSEFHPGTGIYQAPR